MTAVLTPILAVIAITTPFALAEEKRNRDRTRTKTKERWKW